MDLREERPQQVWCWQCLTATAPEGHLGCDATVWCECPCWTGEDLDPLLLL